MIRIALAVLGTALALGTSALGQNAAPGAADKDKAGPPSMRYRFSHTAEGVLRLDNETGQVTLCRAVGGAWVCNPAPEETAVLQLELKKKDAELDKLAADFGGLQAQLTALKSETAALGAKLVEAGKQAISQEERQGLVSRIALLEQDNSGLQGAVKRLEADNAKLKQQIAGNTIRPQPAEEWKPAIAQANENSEALRRELAAAKEQIAGLRKQMAAQNDRDALAAELARLKEENAELTDKVTSLQIDSATMQQQLAELTPPPTVPPAAVPPDKKDELKLPSREEMERMGTALNDAWRRLMDMIGQLQKDLTGKGDSSVRL